MDEDLVEALGATPIAGQLAAIENIGSIQQLVRTTAQIDRAGVLRDTVVFSIVRDEWPTVRLGLRERLGLGR